MSDAVDNTGNVLGISEPWQDPYWGPASTGLWGIVLDIYRSLRGSHSLDTRTPSLLMTAKNISTSLLRGQITPPEDQHQWKAEARRFSSVGYKRIHNYRSSSDSSSINTRYSVGLCQVLALVVKNLPSGLIPGLGRSPEEENGKPLQRSLVGYGP